MAYIGKIPDLIHPTTGQSTSEDIFTATANQTVFTLTADVSAETDIIAAINGVVQSGTAYAVSGTGNRTLTFTAGLTVGDQLRVLHIGFKPATNFVPDNSVTTVKINADAVTNAKMADDAIGVAELSATGTADNTKFLRGDNSWQVVSSYTHPNHSGEVTSTADGAQVIADNIVDEANLKVSNSPTNGQFLSAQSGNTGGLTWAEAGSTSASDLTSGTLPMARLSGTLPALNGSALTALNGTQVTSGTLPMARLSGTLPALNGSALTNLPSTTQVFAGAFYNSSVNTPGAYTITGVGFEPDVIWVSQIANRAAPGVSYGLADGTEEHCFAQYNTVGTADTWDDNGPYLFRLFSSSGNSVQATLTSMNADGFTFTITETGTYTTADGTIMYMCWKA